MSKILKVRNKDALKGAIDLGIAMQLTNIARDVCEDKARVIDNMLITIFWQFEKL